jgi:hypothetical protein
MKIDKELKIRLTEIFMAKAGKNGWDRCFHGTIRREVDENGNTVVCSKIKVNNGYIYAKASDQWQLGDMLDEIVLLVLDKGIHSQSGVSVKICDSDYFLN